MLYRPPTPKACQRCQSARIMTVMGKVSDAFSGDIGEKRCHGYVPEDLGIGGGDYVAFFLCLDCGQIQGEWPRPPTALESGG